MSRLLRSLTRWIGGFMLGAAIAFLAASVAVAVVGNGTINGQDVGCCGWPGEDGPGPQENFAYGEIAHDLKLAEWVEPYHDWVYNRDIIYSSTAAAYLLLVSDIRNLEYSIKIENQSYYNGRQGGGTFTTNVPYTKAPEGSSFFEEATDGYTEMEMEDITPDNYVAGRVYWWDNQFDSEKSAISGAPQFRSVLELCNEFWQACTSDRTGIMYKKVLQQ